MWKPLSAISSVLLLGSAFITFKFKSEMQQEKDLVALAGQNKSAAQKRQKEANEALKTDEKELETANGQRDAMKTELTEAKSKHGEATKALDEAKAKLSEVETTKTDWDRKIADLGGLETIKMELGQLAAQRADTEGKISARKATIAASLTKQQEQEQAIGALKKKVQMQAQGLIAENFSAAISSVDPQWGFITINKGNSANVVRNAKLDVVRGADKIATLIVRSVQPSSAVCDVLTGTLASGQQVMTGDRLVVNADSSDKNLSVAPVATAPAGAPAAAPAAPAADPFAPAASPAAAADPFAPSAAAAPAAEAPAAAAAAAPDPFAPAMPK
jgi:hypothetical protein